MLFGLQGQLEGWLIGCVVWVAEPVGRVVDRMRCLGCRASWKDG